MTTHDEVHELYHRLIDGWNASDAGAMAAVIASDGLVIGFDGSQMVGRDEIATRLGQVFSDHQTATYVTKVRATKSLGSSCALLDAPTR